MDEYRSEEKLNEDQYILDERKYYVDLLHNKRDSTRKEVKDRMLETNTNLNKNLPDEKPVICNWEDVIETLGYTIARNKLYQETKDCTIYHGNRTIPPMQPCLCKVLHEKEHKKNYSIKSMERVVKIVLTLKSDRIVKLLGAIHVKQTDKMYFFEELTKMPLTHYFKNSAKGPLDQIKAKQWLLEISSGLLYLHNHGFAHQKVSLDCCFVKPDGESIKIGCPDALVEVVVYDLMKAYSKQNELQRPIKKTQCSSYDQLFGDMKTYDPMAADVWALGVMLYYFLTLKYPFNGWKNKKEFSTEVQCKRWSFIGMMDNNPRLDEDTKVFLSKLFVSSPEARLTMHEIIVDSYLLKKTDEPPPPVILPPAPSPPPILKGEMEQEYDFCHQDRQANMNNLKTFHDSYNEKYRYRRFVNLAKDYKNATLSSKEFEKANSEEGISKEAKVLRTNLIFEANEAQLYEGILNDEHYYVKVDLIQNFVKKYQVKSIDNHIKLLFQLRAPEKFISLVKCYLIQNKCYLFINANKSLSRLSAKLQEETPINITLARVWTRQMLDATHYLNSKGLALLYLDPEFIYVKGDNQLLIGQTESLYSIFSFDEAQGSKVTYPTRNPIKTIFSSPESIYTETTYDPFSAGIWTIASIMYHLLFLRAPFEVKTKKIFLEQIEQKRWLHVFDKKYKLENDFFSFFDSIFIENSEARPVTIELLFNNVAIMAKNA